MRDGGQLDLFSISVVDPPWRDNRDAMAYPFLANEPFKLLDPCL